ncbi:MAG: FecR domain-containing protein [Burkholderiales bacterium]
MQLTHALLRQTAIAASVAAAFPGFALAQNAARVDFAIGNPTATGADGRSRPLVKGAEVRVGELVSTGQGRVQLRFADGAQMALQPGTDFKVEEFRFAQKGEGEDNVVMNLLKGGMRTITGLIGRSNQAKYALKTPSATIGIRGTEFTAEFADSLRAFCVEGLIFLANEGGSLLLGSGQGAFVSTFTAPPQRDDTKPSLPTISKQEMEVLLQLAGVDPTNPLQDFDPVVTLQTALAQVSETRLVGTLNGNWAAVINQSGSDPGSVRNMPVTFDNSGNLTQFNDTSASYTASTGTATSKSAGNDGIIAWGKWSDGVTGGNNPAFGNKDLGNGPLHYVAGLPVSSTPTTGVATYSMLGSSASCFGNGCTTATVESSSLSVDFKALSVSLSMGLRVDGTDSGLYQYTGSSGTLSSGGFQLSGAFSGGTGSSGSSFSGAGFLSGSGALRAGLAWDGLLGANSTRVAGANAYSRGTISDSSLLTGTFSGNWAAALLGDSGGWHETGQQVTLDSGGRLTQFADNNEGPGTTSLGTATATSSGNDGAMAWGKWMGGTTAGDGFFSSSDLSSSPLYYVVGLPVSSMPTSGTATYNLGSHIASCSGGSCTSATVNSSSLSVDFGAMQVGVAMSLTVNGSNAGTWTVSGLTPSLNASGGFSGSGSMTGPGCAGALYGAGFLSGSGAARAGMAWNGYVGIGTNVAGANVYTKQ